VVLAGGPLRAWPATLLTRSRLAVALADRLGIAAAVGGPLLGVKPLDGAAGPLAVGSLGRVMGLEAKGPVRVGDLVGVPVLLDLGGGLAPGPPAPGRRRHRTEGLQDIAGPILLDGEPGGARLPGQGPHQLPILGAEVGVGLQPALAPLLVLAQLPLSVMGPVGLLGGHRQATRHPGRLVAAVATPPAKHAGRLATAGLLVGGQGLLGLLAVGGGPGEFLAAIPGGLVELAAQPVPLGPQLGRGQPPQIRAAESVDGQGLAARPGQGLGELQVPIGLVAVGQVQLPSPLGFGADHRVQAGVLAGRDSCTYSQFTSSVPKSRTRARPRVRPWARWPVVA
jgi:hypothetical protein